MKITSFQKAGFGLTEVVIGTGLFLVIALSLVVTLTSFLQRTLQHTPELQASFLLEEGMEVVRFFRDQSWSASLGGGWSEGVPYAAVFNGSEWYMVSTSTPMIDATFLRTITYAPVERDAEDNIVYPGGSVVSPVSNDPNTKKVVVSVAWFREGATTTKSMEAYFSDLFEN